MDLTDILLFPEVWHSKLFTLYQGIIIIHFIVTLKEVYEDKLMSCVKYAAGKPPTCLAQS
jgi:hypothetical protein